LTAACDEPCVVDGGIAEGDRIRIDLAVSAELPDDSSELPPAVEKSLQQQAKGPTIKAITTETENGRLVYEAELIIDGYTKDNQFDAKGNIQEVEE
jgi:hypothetical protein